MWLVFRTGQLERERVSVLGRLCIRVSWRIGDVHSARRQLPVIFGTSGRRGGSHQIVTLCLYGHRQDLLLCRSVRCSFKVK